VTSTWGSGLEQRGAVLVERGGDAVRASVQLVGRVVEVSTAPARGLARFGSNTVLAAVLAVLGGLPGEQSPDDAAAGDEQLAAADGAQRAALVTRSLLDGNGCFTRVQVAERAGVPLEQARRLWRAVGFPEVDDTRRVFTSSDVAALADAARLVESGVVDADGAVALARPLGHLLSRLAAAQVGLVSGVLGERLLDGQDAERAATDPELAEHVAGQAVQVTRELLPVLERTTLYVWRRHLATEAGRALVPAVDDTDSSARLAVGFVDISGFTRLSRGLDGPELDRLLECFEVLVGDTVVARGGRVVKTLGDEVLFVTDTPEAAADIALTLLEETAADPSLPPVHAGLAYGPVLSRGGDVFGPVVNVAARLASLARRDTIRVDQALAEALAGTRQFDLSVRAPRPVRGYAQLRSYRLRRARA